MTLKITAIPSAIRRFPISCFLAVSLSATAMGADAAPELDDLFESSESLIPKSKDADKPVATETDPEAVDSDAIVPPPPPTPVVSKEDLTQEESPQLAETPEAETSEAEAVEEQKGEEVEQGVQEELEVPQVDPGSELLRLREENSVLKEQLRRVDSSVAERDVKIGELQEDIAKLTEERDAISTQLQKSTAELGNEIQMLKTKASVLEQSILQHEISKQEEMSLKSSRETRFKGVVNRYLEPSIEYITPVYP